MENSGFCQFIRSYLNAKVDCTLIVLKNYLKYYVYNKLQVNELQDSTNKIEVATFFLVIYFD